ncbi:MAG: heme-binding protein [Deltaproteobacteria bacterium]|nr:heme-binding protein [Deltaproteobacteria bacterium]
MRSKFSLTLEDVHRIVAACRREAGRAGRAATIAVVDGSGVLMYLERPDDQPVNSVDMATGKARTAAFRERPSSSLEARVKERPGFLTYPNAIAVTGGVPLIYQGQCVGGVGVSGIADDDEVVAKAGAEALAGGG